MIKRTLSGSALFGLIGGALSVVVACAGEDPADKKGSGGSGGTGGGKGGVGGTVAGSGGSVGGTGGAVGGTAGTATGGTAGAPLGGAGAGGGAGVPGGSSGAAGESGAAGSASGAAGAAGDAAGGMAGGGGISGMAGMGGAPVVGAMAAYHFDTASVPLAGAGGAAVDGTEGWQINSGACKANGGETSVTVTQSTEQHQAGTGSLKILFTGIPTGAAGAGGMGAAGAAGAAGSGAGTAGGGAGGAAAGAAGAAGSAGTGGAAPVSVDCHIKKTAAPLETGKTITYQIWISPDAGGSVGWIKLILEAGATYSWVSPPQTDAMPDIPLTTRSAWVMKSFTVPVSVVPPIQSIGFQIGVQNTFTGSIYIDEVTW